MSRRDDFKDNMSEAEAQQFYRQLHNNKLTILISDLMRVQRNMNDIFKFDHADSKLIDDIIKDMEEAKYE